MSKLIILLLITTCLYMTFIYKGKIGSIFQFVFYMLFFSILILIKNLFIIAFDAILIYIGAITILFVFFYNVC